MTEIETGKRVWLIDGTEASYIQRLNGDSHLVSPTLEFTNWEGDTIHEQGSPQIVGAVYPSAPHYIYDDKIKQAETKIGELEKRTHDLYQETAKVAQDRAALGKKLAQAPALQRIEDFLEGRMTHLLIIDYSDYAIEPISHLEINKYGRVEGLKLLTLYGGTKGDLSWKVNTYSDGSGGETTVIPATSKEEAESLRLQRIADDLVTGKRLFDAGQAYYLLKAVKLADKYGVEVSDEIRSIYIKAERERLEKERIEAARYAEQYVGKLEGIDADLAALVLIQAKQAS